MDRASSPFRFVRVSFSFDFIIFFLHFFYLRFEKIKIPSLTFNATIAGNWAATVESLSHQLVVVLILSNLSPFAELSNRPVVVVFFFVSSSFPRVVSFITWHDFAQ